MQAAWERDMVLKRAGGTAADGERRAADERKQSQAEARSYEAPLGEAYLSEERTAIFEAV
jgi:hypothetical protein